MVTIVCYVIKIVCCVVIRADSVLYGVVSVLCGGVVAWQCCDGIISPC